MPNYLGSRKVISRYRVSGGGTNLIVVSTTTWNPADVNGALTLSGGNLTVAAPASDADRGVRTIASASSGKKYWEILLTSYVVFSEVGIANATASLSNYIGSDTNSLGMFGDGTVFLNAAQQGPTIQTYTLGDTLCIAFDMDNSKIWFRTNGGNWNNAAIGSQNPATNTGGISTSGMAAGPYFAMVDLQKNGNTFTANFGGLAFAQTPPSGFGNW